jgi:hypothetical protein
MKARHSARSPIAVGSLSGAILVMVCLLLPFSVAGQDGIGDPPDLSSLVEFGRSESDMRMALERYGDDRGALMRRYDVPFSPVRRARMLDFYAGWGERLQSTDFAGLNHEGQIDYVLLRNRLEFEVELLRQEELQVGEMAALLPFARELELLQEGRRDRIRRLDGRVTADMVTRVAAEVEALSARIRDGADLGPMKGVVAEKAARRTEGLLRILRGWHGYHSGYDPDFTWWMATPWERLSEALPAHAAAIRSRYVGDAASGPVIGDPIGAQGLRAHLDHEMIPYTPEELISIAEEEFAWMEEALVDAAREMGYDDWREAQEAVKNLAVPPGEKPGVVLDIEQQSIEFIEARDWIDLPPLAHEVWRMEMMSPERQRVAPFFLGGEVIQISYPTHEMTHDEKLMSMRGNNPHFNRATVHHELIPGHHLQGFMTTRFNSHRNMFRTPFWGEGWALYWEILLWENDFPRGPEDRIGMLFWRMHRAARIIFSLSFHLERMTPQEAVDFLVDRVGHERANAEAEVRRSFSGDYSPLYQVGYMWGGFQFRALYAELVESGQMTAREFHDAVLKGGRMPVEMVRARLTGQALTRDHEAEWRHREPG